MAHLGRPLPGAPMLGGLAALAGVVSLDAVLAAISERFAGQVAAGNARDPLRGHRHGRRPA